MFGEGQSATARDAQLDPRPETGGLNPGGAPRDEPMIDLSEYWRLVVKHRMLIAATFVAAVVLGLTTTFLMTPIYTASTTIQIDREAARVLNVEDVSPQESMVQGEEFFQTQYGLLQSQSLADRVMDSLGLANGDAFLEEMNRTPPKLGREGATKQRAERREMVRGVLLKNLHVSPVRGSRLAKISFDSPSPRLSAQIANAFAENFIQSNLDRKYESSSYAREFLEERLGQTKAKLEDAERQLVAYAANQQIINVAEPQGENAEPQSLAANNLSSLNRSLIEATAARVAAEEKWRQAQSGALMNLPEVLENPAVQRLVEERAKLDAQYQQKLQVYRPDFPEMLQLKAQVDALNSQINSIAGSIRSSVQERYRIAANQERSLSAQVNNLKGDVLDMRNRSIQYNILQRELDTSRTLYDGLLQRYKEVGITAGVATNNISIVDRADVPSAPSKPNLLINLVISCLLGLGLGILAAFVLEALDETLANPEDVESKLGVPVLGVVPLLPKGETPLDALANIRSAFSEAYYSLRTALQFSTPNGAPFSLLVTSSRPAEGKSTTAFAIALNLSRVGKRVLLIDGDLRNPSMHRLLKVDNDRGASNLLSRAADIAAVVHPTSFENLFFIPCGPLPPSPAELWAGDRLREVLSEASASYDHVVIDGPPVLGFSDAPLLASAVGGTLFVVEARSTRRAQAKGAIRRLLIGNGRLLGIVLSKFNTKTLQYGGYDYAYDYSYGAGSGPKRAGKR